LALALHAALFQLGDSASGFGGLKSIDRTDATPAGSVMRWRSANIIRQPT
jgi:hypothetical protein